MCVSRGIYINLCISLTLMITDCSELKHTQKSQKKNNETREADLLLHINLEDLIKYFAAKKCNRKHNQAQIIKKSVFLFWLPNMTI